MKRSNSSSATIPTKIPTWDGLRNIDMVDWIGSGIYEKSYFKDPKPSIMSEHAARVIVRKDDDDLFTTIIHMNDELREFLSFLERNTCFSTLPYEYELNLPVFYDKVYMKSYTPPILFDVGKDRVHYERPINVMAKFKLSAQSISHKKGTSSYYLFLVIDQLLFHDIEICEWV
jgi:hypothetical protein